MPLAVGKLKSDRSQTAIAEKLPLTNIKKNQFKLRNLKKDLQLFINLLFSTLPLLTETCSVVESLMQPLFEEIL